MAFDLGIVGHHRLEGDSHLVQTGDTDGQAGCEHNAFDALGHHTQAAAGHHLGRRDQVAASHQFRQDHGDGLDDLDLLFGVAA